MPVAWIPVVDQSQHQGPTDFRVMKAKGVQGLILRIAHGLTLDALADSYYAAAVAAGFDPSQIGWYGFINPKRGSAADTAVFAVEQIERITGSRDFFYMADVENYRNESPNIGQAPVYGQVFADYIRLHLDTIGTIATLSRRLGYSHRAYWNGKVASTTSEWVGDDILAAELDFIVARYPAYSDAAYARTGYPGTPDTWDEWAFKAQPQGPIPPRGATWQGWQFSAGWNRQGSTYGVTSRDLDLNFVHPDAWARWTSTPVPPTPPTPIPPGDDDMQVAMFEVEGLPGIYMWAPGMPEPIPFTNPIDFNNLATSLGSVGNGTKISQDMYNRLFVKPVTVTVPPIVVPPVTVTFPTGTSTTQATTVTTWDTP